MIHGVNPRASRTGVASPSPRNESAPTGKSLRELLDLGDDDMDEIEDSAPPSWRDIAWQTLEDPSYSPASQAWIMLIMVCTALSTIMYCAETEFKHGVPDEEQDPFDWWFWSDLVMVLIFSVDLIARFTVCPNHAAFLKSAMNWIDLLSVLPSWVEWALIAALGTGTSRRFDLRVLRVLRLIKIFRVLKFGRYSKGMQTFVMALTKSSEPLIILFFLLGIAMVVFASLMHLVEGQSGDPRVFEAFETIPRAFWWTLVTMTTVGYGDAYPVTDGGYAIATACMMVGIIIMALPITVLGTTFTSLLEERTRIDALYKLADTTLDGKITTAELTMFLRLGYESGLLLEDVFPAPDPNGADQQHPVNMRSVRALMNRYTKKHNQGWVDYDEFERLLKESWLELHTEESLQAKIMAEMTDRLNSRMLERQQSRTSQMQGPPGAGNGSAPFAQRTLQELASTFQFVGARRGSRSVGSRRPSSGSTLAGAREANNGPGALLRRGHGGSSGAMAVGKSFETNKLLAAPTDPAQIELQPGPERTGTTMSEPSADTLSQLDMLVRMVSALDAKLQSNTEAVARLEGLLTAREAAPGAADGLAA